MSPKVPFIKPKLPDPDSLADDIKRIYQNNYYSNNGPIYFEFKEALENYLEQDLHCVIVSNATLGLMLAMAAVFGEATAERKFVAVPSFTFSAGPLAIKWCGFEPVFFDINADDTQPSIDSFNRVVDEYGHQLAGVFLINSFGIGNVAIDTWESRLNELSLPCIIDSAPGFGSTYTNGKLLGGKGSCEVFSLHATKPFGIGEGGVISTKDADLADRLESLKNFGFDKDKETVGPGLNAKITELDCAIGLRVLKNYKAVLEDRRQTYHRYEENLANCDVRFLPRAETAAIQFATVLAPASSRQAALKALAANGVEARTYYAPAVHTFSYFADCPRVDLPNTEQLSKSVLSLPVHPQMAPQTIGMICEVIRSELDKKG
jgi:dTDP-4-amino-4,6-dideoxygalactose transaminase